MFWLDYRNDNFRQYMLSCTQLKEHSAFSYMAEIWFHLMRLYTILLGKFVQVHVYFLKVWFTDVSNLNTYTFFKHEKQNTCL